MNNFKMLAMVLVMGVALGLVGCGQKPAGNAQQAIEESKAKGSVQEQVNYLAGQAKAFVNSKNYDQAMTAANYILANLDNNSQVAKDILEKAKAELQKVAEAKVKELKSSFGGLGK